jgi:uncharacterized OB-fold protein
LVYSVAFVVCAAIRTCFVLFQPVIYALVAVELVAGGAFFWLKCDRKTNSAGKVVINWCDGMSRVD